MPLDILKCVVVHLQFFLTNATDWIGTIGIDDLNDSSITKVKKLGNMEVLFYWFLQMPILCSTKEIRLKMLLISRNAIQSQFFAHYSVPKQKESMNIKRNTYTVWENHLKSLIQNGEWSELRWHFHEICQKWSVFEKLLLAVKQCYQTGQLLIGGKWPKWKTPMRP